MPARSIVIDLLMRTGAFETDSARAAKSLRGLERTAKTTGAGMQAAFAGIAAAIGGVFTGTAIVGAIRNVANQLDQLGDLSTALGASVEKLSALERLAMQRGAGIETVSDSIFKLNQLLATAAPESQQARALKAIGLSVEELRKLDPADAIVAVAKALQGYADDGERARLVTLLFGRQSRDLAKFLEETAKAGKLQATTTREQVEAAEAFNNQLSEMKTQIGLTSRAVFVELLPGLNAILKVFREDGLIAAVGEFWKRLTEGDPDLVFAQIAKTTDEVARLAKLREELAAEGPLTQAARALLPLPTLAEVDAQLAAAEERLDALKARTRPFVGPLQESGKPTVKLPSPTAPKVGKAQFVGPELSDPLAAALRALDSTAPKKLAELNSQLLELVAIRRQLGGGGGVDEAIRNIQSAIDELNPRQTLAELGTIPTVVAGGFDQTEDAADRAAEAARRFGDQLQEARDRALDLGYAIASSVEASILRFEKLSDVVNGVLRNVAAVLLRRFVTDPLAQGLAGLFGPGRAAGGPVSPGIAYPVNERGMMETFIPNTSGRVVPLGAVSGGSGDVRVIVNAPPGTEVQRQESRSGPGGREVELWLAQRIAQRASPINDALRSLGLSQASTLARRA